MKLIILVVVGTLLIAAGLIFGLSNSGGESGGGKIAITPAEYDFGTVQISAGLVKKTYEEMVTKFVLM